MRRRNGEARLISSFLADSRRSSVHGTNNESGQTSIEYALALVLVAIALAVSAVALNAPFANYVVRLATSLA
jgi:Flp pilus assembly pilin Flp